MSEEVEKQRSRRGSKSTRANGEPKHRSSRHHRSSSRDSHDDDILGGSERKSSGSKPERRRSKDDDDIGGSRKRSSGRPSRRKSRDSHDDELGGSLANSQPPEKRKSTDSDNVIGKSDRRSSERPSRRKSRDSHGDELGGSSGNAQPPGKRKSKDSNDNVIGSRSDRRSYERPSRRKSRDSHDERSSVNGSSTSQDSNDSGSAKTEDKKAKAKSRRMASIPAMPGAFEAKSTEDKAVRRKRDAAYKGREAGDNDRESSDREAKNRARRQPGETKPGSSIEIMDRRAKDQAWRSVGSDIRPGASSHESMDRTVKDQAKRSVGGAVRPGASSETRGSREAKSKRDTSRQSTEAHEDEISLPPASKIGWTGDVEAVEAIAVDEMEATIPSSPQEVREEAPNETEEEDGRATARREKKSRKYKYMLAAFVVFAIFAGVLVWLLVLRDSSEPDGVSISWIFAPPTTEDCLAISQGVETADQMGATVKYFGVEMDFAVAPNVDLDFLESELQMRIQLDVLPLVAGCDKEGSISTENDSFIVENSVLNSISIGDLATCSSNSEGVCSFVYLQLDLFSKDANVQSAVLLALISDVFQDEGLLELLNLLSPVEGIDYITAYEIVLSGGPSSSPSIQEDGSPPIDNGSPSQETCDAIANGTPVSGREDLVVQEYDILMDVVLDSETEELSPLTTELDEKIQRFLLPSLVGCETKQRRRLQIESFVVNALVDSEGNVGGSCLPDSETPCHRYVIHLDIYVQRTVSSADFSQDILEKFREAPLVERLGLLPPFQNITVVDIASDAASFSPSIPPSAPPSINPTTSPVTYPTTDVPTKTPTTAPSFNPTKAPVAFPTTAAPTALPTKFPTRGPTSGPTPVPSLQPIVGPTLEPSPSPSLEPSGSPSVSPSAYPSSKPSAEPTTTASSWPSVPPSFQPTPSPPSSQPSTSPSTQPSSSTTNFQCFETSSDLSNEVGNWLTSSELKASVEAQYGPIGDWCFSAGVTSMARLFEGQSTFNEDISKWDVSSVTNMEYLFYRATSFNQDLSLWDVSSVTNMLAMFTSLESFNQDLSSWNVSSVTNMDVMFRDTPFNQDLSSWDVSSVTTMSAMFAQTPFNGDISSWDVSSVDNMFSMFQDASSFNQDLSSWDISSVTSMQRMFQRATSFNQDISSWDVSSVARMQFIFNGASSFNQNLCAWGSRLSSSVPVMNSFLNTNSCPSTSSAPDLFANPPGPFCHIC
ncbi:unnamed protein product [Cylindrotheca closterium]|uniref:Circumsporozoite protein n=1 Tax=Cylindrotheca closterium TaxID=2856 RepID=A0AAD2FZN7_9STRA|nr:unnamed protein product [Cylindrotheca closterium]